MAPCTDCIAGTKGYNDADEGEWLLVRSKPPVAAAAGEALHLQLFERPQPAQQADGTVGDTDEGYDPATGFSTLFTLAPVGRQHWAGLALLLNAFDTATLDGGGSESEKMAKLGALGITDGLNAEAVVLDIILAADKAGDASARVLLASGTNQVCGLQHTAVGLRGEVYCCPAASAADFAHAELAAEAAAMAALAAKSPRNRNT